MVFGLGGFDGGHAHRDGGDVSSEGGFGADVGGEFGRGDDRSVNIAENHHGFVVDRHRMISIECLCVYVLHGEKLSKFFRIFFRRGVDGLVPNMGVHNCPYYGWGLFSESAGALGVFTQCPQEIEAAEGRPVGVGEPNFRVGRLPQEEAG